MIIYNATDLNLALVKTLYPLGLAHKSKDIIESFVNENNTLRHALDTILSDTEESIRMSIFRTINRQMC